MPAGNPVAQPLWLELRGHAEPVSVQHLARTLSIRATSVMLRLTRWERAGLIERTGFQKICPGIRTVTFIMKEAASKLPNPPRVAPNGEIPSEMNGRQRIWSAIRVLKRFSRKDAEITSEQSRRSVEDYLNCLLRAGYICRARTANPNTGELAIYQVVRNTGRKAPVVSHGRRDGVRFREVIDPNDDRCHDIAPKRASGLTTGGQ